MKKREARRLAATGVMTGSPTLGRGVDIGALYIDMLCEKFKDRGIRMGVSQNDGAKNKRDSIARRRMGLGLSETGVSAADRKYNSLNINGRPCMSSDDFANYYKDLRDYKMPRFYSRDEKEYKEAEAAAAENVQESGKPPKKAVWLAISKHAKKKICEIPSHLNKEEFEEFAKDWFLAEGGEESRDTEKKKIPAGVISTLCVVTVSLMLIVCSSVMVSRASANVSSLEERIDSLCYEINDLEGKLEVKNNMLDIKRIATEEYGMISADYASSKYIDMKEDEKLEAVEAEKDGGTWFSQLLKAIGFGS